MRGMANVHNAEDLRLTTLEETMPERPAGRRPLRTPVEGLTIRVRRCAIAFFDDAFAHKLLRE